MVPTPALHVHDNCYRILAASCDPEHDYWMFEAPDVVQCIIGSPRGSSLAGHGAVSLRCPVGHNR